MSGARVARFIVVILAILLWHPAALGQQPITRRWLLENILRPAYDDSGEQKRALLWAQVRSKPETLDSLIEIFEDPGAVSPVRSAALLRIGATGQASAYEYLLRQLPRVQGSTFGIDLILALGSGPREPPAAALQQLQLILNDGTRELRRLAAFSLGSAKGRQGQQIIRKRLDIEPDSLVRSMIRERLERRRSE